MYYTVTYTGLWTRPWHLTLVSLYWWRVGSDVCEITRHVRPSTVCASTSYFAMQWNIYTTYNVPYVIYVYHDIYVRWYKHMFIEYNLKMWVTRTSTNLSSLNNGTSGKNIIAIMRYFEHKQQQPNKLNVCSTCLSKLSVQTILQCELILSNRRTQCRLKDNTVGCDLARHNVCHTW